MMSAFALMATLAEAQEAGESALTMTRVIKFGSLPEKVNANGSSTRGFPKDTVPMAMITGMHFSTIPPGKMFAPLHRSGDYEFRMIYQGKAELVTEGNPPQLAEPGDIVFSVANSLNTMQNPGTVPCTYFVVSVKGPGMMPVSK